MSNQESLKSKTGSIRRRSTRSQSTKIPSTTTSTSTPNTVRKEVKSKRSKAQQDIEEVKQDQKKEDNEDRVKEHPITPSSITDEIESTFEIVVLGSGGGPLETDCSGYLLKATKSSWEDGILALEGGSGLGALASILSSTPSTVLFPDLKFPPNYNTPLLQAAHVFSFLACYLITHAHLDHVGSLVMLSGSVPHRSNEHTQPPTTSPSSSLKGKEKQVLTHPRPHVYGTRKTLEQLSQAYQGGLWPELGSWVPDREGEENGEENGEDSLKKKKKRKLNGNSKEHEEEKGNGSSKGKEFLVNGSNGLVEGNEDNFDSCLLFSPLSTERVHRPLHHTLPLSLLTYPVVHGCTSKHTYESSAMFIRYDPNAITPTSSSSSTPTPSTTPSSTTKLGKELLFFGDVESSYRRKGEEGIDSKRAKEAKELNEVIWKEAGKSWKDGRLCGIFIECSYDSSRPAHLMFGHLSPPGLYHELKIFAGFVSTTNKRPLNGLKIFIIHIKDALVPHPSGKTAREIIMSELNELEEKGQLGVDFIETKRGDRIVI